MYPEKLEALNQISLRITKKKVTMSHLNKIPTDLQDKKEYIKCKLLRLQV